MCGMRPLIRLAFAHFYTTFAWTYDAVADLVSFGEWQMWGRSALAFLPRAGHGAGRGAGRVLEIAHGPGHLHRRLHELGYRAVGIDLSPQMGRMTRQRLTGSGWRPALVRADALRLPFADGAFTCAVSTFPAEFIFARQTLSEVKRVIEPGGRLVIVPTARLKGRDAATALIKLAYRLTGQGESPMDWVKARFEAMGYAFESHTVPTPRAEVTVWVATVAPARRST